MPTGYHESEAELSQETKEIHRVLASFIEELEAVDWYHQRVDVTQDESVKAILAHNRDEEIEHAVMCLEWLRRHMPKFDEELRTYLFTRDPITELENGEEEGEETQTESQGKQGGTLGIGKIQKEEK